MKYSCPRSRPARWLRCMMTVLLLVVFTAAPTAAMSSTTGANRSLHSAEDITERLQTWLPQALERYQVPGAALALVQDGRTVVLTDAGTTSLAGGQPVDASLTAFNAPAFGRLLVAIAALQLESQGKLDLLAPLGVLPEEITLPPSGGAELTLAHLLTRSAGLSERTIGTARTDASEVPSSAQALREMRQTGVVYPETTLSESAYIPALAALLVEHAAGMRYSDYVEASILRPLGMGASSIAQPLPLHVAAQAASGHSVRLGKLNTMAARSYLLPTAEGFYLSAADGAALVQALLGGGARGGERILSSEQTARLLQPQFTLAAGAPGVTLAFDELWLGTDRLLELASSSGGFTGAILLWPSGNLGAVLLYNSDSPELCQAFQEELFGQLGIGLAQAGQPASRLDPVYADQVAGYYRRLPLAVPGAERTRLLFQADSDTELIIRVSSAGLLSVEPGAPAAWVQLEPGLFGDTAQRRWLSLQLDNTGRIARVVLNRSSYTRILWYESFYWQRRLGLVLIGLLLLGILPFCTQVLRKKRPPSALALSAVMAGVSLLLIICALGWYLVYTGGLQLGLPAAAVWLKYLAWAAGLAAVGGLVLLAVDVIRRRSPPLGLSICAGLHGLAVAGALWYAYYWYLV